MKKINNVNDFNEFIKSDKLTVVKFSAEWCGPCRQLANTIESIENNYDNVNFIEIDVDDTNNDEIVSNYNIRNIPVLIFIKNDEVLERSVGSIDKVTLNNKIDKFLS